LTFNELVRRLEREGFRLASERGSVRIYRHPISRRWVRVDYHGSKEIAVGTLHVILKQAGLKPEKGREP